MMNDRINTIREPEIVSAYEAWDGNGATLEEIVEDAAEYLLEIGHSTDPHNYEESCTAIGFRAGYIAALDSLAAEIKPVELSETGWMIEATQAQCEQHSINAPAWWAGVDPHIDEVFSSDPNEGVRFSRKEDAEKVIRGWGYTLENPWVKATDHRWG
jgi:hypothetical protein